MTDDYRISVRCHECGRVEERPLIGMVPVQCACGKVNQTASVIGCDLATGEATFSVQGQDGVDGYFGFTEER